MSLRVETYVPVDNDLVKKVITSRDKSSLQGNNILLTSDRYDKEEIEAFLSFVFADVNKIVLEKGMKQFFLLVCHVKEDVEEPFESFSDVTEELDNDFDAIVRYIATA